MLLCKLSSMSKHKITPKTLPLSLKLASNHPQNKFFWFHSDSPWRTITILYFPAILAIRIIFAACLNHQSKLSTASTTRLLWRIYTEIFSLIDLHNRQVISVGIELQFNLKLVILHVIWECSQYPYWKNFPLSTFFEIHNWKFENNDFEWWE